MLPSEPEKTNCRDQQFSITFGNNLFKVDLAVVVRIDGERIYRGFLRAGQRGQVLGLQKSATSILPFKFQELELVGASPGLSLDSVSSSYA
jgi:hypothetical protein